MFPPLLHFGYFDREALCQGRLLQREVRHAVRFRVVFHELFGGLPGLEMPGRGFFDSYGVLSCCCPSSLHGLRLPVERILDLVRLTGCDVVYVGRDEHWLIEAERLLDILEPPADRAGRLLALIVGGIDEPISSVNSQVND